MFSDCNLLGETRRCQVLTSVPLNVSAFSHFQQATHQNQIPFDASVRTTSRNREIVSTAPGPCYCERGWSGGRDYPNVPQLHQMFKRRLFAQAEGIVRVADDITASADVHAYTLLHNASRTPRCSLADTCAGISVAPRRCRM